MALVLACAACGSGSPHAARDAAYDVPIDGAVQGDARAADTGPPNPATAYVQSIRYNLSAVPMVDLLFVIDDSSGMASLQMKMRDRLPDFMSVLSGLPGGLPDLQVAVVSTSLGAGIFANVTGCTPGSAGNLDGNFQHKAGCGLKAGETFVKSAPGAAGRTQNFDGEIANVVSCLTNLGQSGCNFEHPFEALRLAIQKTQVPGTDNWGFLRDGAILAVVILTNEDDCSVPAASMLLDPNQQSVMNALGGLQSYRCNEFGHKCDQPFPHTPPAAPVTMTGCVSAEDGMLVTVDGMVQFMKSIKAMPMDQVLLAAIAGPPQPYVVEAKTFNLASGAAENQPAVKHSCVPPSTAAEFGDPAVRIKQFLDPFGGLFETVCQNDYRDSMVRIAQAIAGRLGGACFSGHPLERTSGGPDCLAALRKVASDGTVREDAVPVCPLPPAGPFPCWTFAADALGACTPSGSRIVKVCNDAACDPSLQPPGKAILSLSCAISEPPQP